jgi:DNA helicase-2/ATP-dependent DNA helicase PcrA
LVHNPNDEVSLGRVINVPPRGVGDKTLVALQLRAHQAGLSAGQVLLDLARGPASDHWQAFSGRGTTVLADFAGRVAAWRGLRETLPLPVLFDHILDDIGYHQYIDDESEEGQDRWANVQELRRIAVEYEDRGMVEFLENIALVSDQDTLPENVNVPTLLTLHAAKGLEFRCVFIVGMDEGLLPHSRARDDPEEMAEERRLFYVGITRAKDRVYLVRAERRSTYGPYEEAIASSFLGDLPESLTTGRRSNGRRRETSATWSGSSYRTDYGSYQVPPPPGRSAAPPRQPQFAPNMRVRHTAWGEGWVLESRIEDDDETVDVAFDSVGFKRLVASLARLEIIPSSKN